MCYRVSLTCTSADLTAAYTTVIPFTPSFLDNWGGSEAVQGFMGVFRFPSSTMMGSSPVRVGFDSSGQYNVQFSVLPGTPDIADSVGVFYRSLNTPQDYYGNGGETPCQQISQGGLGFKNISSIPLVAGTLDYNANNSSPADISSNAVMAFCPMKNGVAIGGGFVTNYLSSGGMGGVPTAANSFSAYTNFNTVGTGQCHKIRLSLVNESSGSTNYNVTNSTTRTFTFSGLVSGSTNTPASVSFFANESTCIAGTSIVSSVAINSNSVNGEIWYKDTTGESVEITITSNSFSTTVSRPVNVLFTTPGAGTNLFVSEGNLNMGANECRVVDVYAVSSTGNVPSPVSSAVDLALSKLNLSLTSVTDTSFDFYSDCASNAAITVLAFTAGDFKKSLAIKTGGSPSSDRVLQLTGLGGGSKIYFNVTPMADHLAIQINYGNPVYQGSCVPVNIEARDSLNNKVNSAFEFNMNVYHPTVQTSFGSIKNGCSSGSANVSGPIMLTAGSSLLAFVGTAPQNGIQMETNSIYQGKMSPITFDIKPAPPVGRSTLKVHLMSDDLEPISPQSAIGMWPTLDTSIPTNSLSTFTFVDGYNNNKRDGALFTSTSSLMSGSFGGFVSDELMMTIKFKISVLPNVGASADILSLDIGGGGAVKIYVDDLSGSTFKIKGSGGWIGPNIAVDTWYTVSLSKDASGNTVGYVNGAPYGSVGAGANTGTGYSTFRIGSGFQGAVKAVIIDTGTSVLTNFDVSGEHQYINNRVPDL